MVLEIYEWDLVMVVGGLRIVLYESDYNQIKQVYHYIIISLYHYSIISLYHYIIILFYYYHIILSSYYRIIILFIITTPTTHAEICRDESVL